jgi:OOP family OmpA-OmpF porin
MKKSLIAALLLALSGTAFAQAYVGGSVGRSKLDTGLSSSDFQFPGVTVSIKETGTSYNLFGGIKLNDVFAVEAAYDRFGDVEVTARSAFGSGSSSIKNEAFSVVGRGTFELNPMFGLTGKLGVARSKSSAEDASSSKTAPVFGIGAVYNINKQVSLLGEYEVYNKFADSDNDMTNFKVSVRVAF